MATQLAGLRYQHRTFHAPVPSDAVLRLCRLAPSGQRIAFVREDGPEGQTGIWIGELHNAHSARLLVPFKPGRVEDLAFSPDGSHIAYRVAPLLGFGARGTIGWASADAPGEIRRVEGTGFGFTPGGKAILVADPYRKVLLRYALDEEEPRELGPFEDDADPSFPAQIVVSPDGEHIVYTAGRDGEEVSEVWLVKRENSAVVTTILTEIPGGNVHILPFWSPKGTTLGLFCVHEDQEKTALIVVPRLEGEGQVLYESSYLDPARTPTFTHAARSIAFFRTEKPGDEERLGTSRLVLLDVKRETFAALAEPDEVFGTPRLFDDRSIAVDGEGLAHLFVFDDPL
ncbi:TolB family protein [Polyangium fumosum]|uniref:S9 family peptidase n=1 Tax=Polyangium fumosum TaxID=889272 RepID=A0A4U1JK22_9BACT|nr:PD40 domain-containing protein [Polyangium fumosum]TKD12176.1 hypothetical protein E8A74_06105 [Polyangium fumosum]